MFDFSNIGMKPRFKDFKPSATETQLSELESYCENALPEDYKTILTKFNGGSPESNCFDYLDESSGVLLEGKLGKFFTLDADKDFPANIWYQIEKFAEYIGPNALPFADDGLQQIYYLKWVDKIPQVWFLAYLDLDEPEARIVKSTFPDLLNGLYNAD